MSDLVVIVYPSEEKAEEVRQRLIKLQKEYLITINDAVIAVKTEAGAVKLNQLVNTTALGAASGSFWGLLIGVLFLNPIIGVALGAASGALGGALTDFGINDTFMKELAASIQPGNAALFVLIKNMTADKVLKEIKDAGGVVLKHPLMRRRNRHYATPSPKQQPPKHRCNRQSRPNSTSQGGLATLGMQPQDARVLRSAPCWPKDADDDSWRLVAAPRLTVHNDSLQTAM